MRLKTGFLATCLVLAGFIGTALAQEPVTILTQSGERISGNLVDLSGGGWTVSVNGQNRVIGADQPAVIDFTGGAQSFPATETSKIAGGQNLLVLRDGQTFTGKMTDIGGTHPLRITFTVDGQQRNFTSDQVARIYLSTPPGSTAGTSGTAAQTPGATGNAIQVPGNRAWTPTGITVQKGQTITFSSSGSVQLSQDTNDQASVAGKGGSPASVKAPMPGTLRGALIGRIGNGKPFGIGDMTSITAPATGPLYLGVNDDVLTDNSGEFLVTVTGGQATGAVRR
jgi:hypothetical protein